MSATWDQIRAASDAGHDDHEIAAELGVPLRRVRHILERIDGVYDPAKVLGISAERIRVEQPERITAALVVKRKPKPKPEPSPKPPVVRTQRRTPECGTYGGYKRHIRRGETVCDDCRTGYRAYKREQHRRLTEGRPPRELQPCGTPVREVAQLPDRRHHPQSLEQRLHCKGAQFRARHPVTFRQEPVDIQGLATQGQEQARALWHSQ